jgi:leader peptidase (prepilin peptidase)/N-methyltransferase
MGTPADENSSPRRELGFGHGACGGDTGYEGAELAVSLIPGRDIARPPTNRWPRALTSPNRRLVDAVALGSIAILTVGVAAGFAPLAASLAVAMLVPAAVIDVEQRRLPDGWVLAALVTLLAAISIGTAVSGPDDVTVGGLAGGALTMGLPVLLLHLVSPAAMGFGDVKAAVVLGAAVGTIDWRLGAVALCLAALVGGVVGVVGRRRTIPFGPFLVFGAWATVLAHAPIVDAVFTNGAAS